jgi:hypothetical protein
MQDVVTRYYVTQAGGGQFYAGTPHQKGYGLGSWLGGLFRTVLPLFKTGALAVGREAARAGSHVLADVATGQNFKGSVNKHMEEAAGNLSTSLKRKLEDTMQGSGAIKRRKTSQMPHSVLKVRRRNIKKDALS